MGFLQYRTHIQDRVEQCAVSFHTILGDDRGVLRADEPLVHQLADMLADRVHAHVQHLTDGWVAGIALIGFSVGTTSEVAVHLEGTGGQTQFKNIIGQREEVAVGFAHASPPAFVCSSTH